MDELLARLVQVAVETGEVQTGSHRLRLPTERALAASLDVPRSLVRERLAALEHLGLVDRTQGSGTYLNPPSADVIRWYFDLALTLGYLDINDIETTRAMLEREIARQAAGVATPDDIVELERLCQRMTAAGSPAERTAIDADFHRQLALSTRNPVIVLIVDGLASVLRRALARRRALVASIPTAAQRQDASHPPIVEAIRARDPDRAALAMDEHFRITDELLARMSTLLVAPTTDLTAHTTPPGRH